MVYGMDLPVVVVAPIAMMATESTMHPWLCCWFNHHMVDRLSYTPTPVVQLFGTQLPQQRLLLPPYDGNFARRTCTWCCK
jgi:hypothetical protein